MRGVQRKMGMNGYNKDYVETEGRGKERRVPLYSCYLSSYMLRFECSLGSAELDVSGQ